MVKKALMTFVVIGLLLGCTSEKKEEMSDTKLLTINDTSIQQKKTLTELNGKDIELDLPINKVFELPNNLNFVPHKLTNSGLILGEATRKDSNSKFLVSINPLTDEINELVEVDMNQGMSSIGIFAVSNQYVFYEIYNHELQSASYYVINLESKAIHEVEQIKFVPSLHFTQASINQNRIAYSVYDELNQTYSLKVLHMDTLVTQIISDQNVGFPTFLNNKLYYLSIDNDNKKTSVVQYDIEKKEARELLETIGMDLYITGLANNEKQLVVLLQATDTTKVVYYDIDSQKIDYQFESNWIETLTSNSQYLSWVGERLTESRTRAQYYLLNQLDNSLYQYDGGITLFSNAGVCYVNYKVPEQEIPKGESYGNKYTNLKCHLFNYQSNDNKSEENDHSQEVGESIKKILQVDQSVQENNYYCTPAAAQMGLRLFGIEKSQDELASMMHTDPVVGTYDFELARVLNMLLFEKEVIGEGEPGYRVTAVDQSESREVVKSLFEQRIVKNIDDGYPSYIQIDLQTLYSDRNKVSHMVIVVGYLKSEQGVQRIYVIDPLSSVQDPKYGGLKYLTVDEVMDAFYNNIEPAYIW